MSAKVKKIFSIIPILNLFLIFRFVFVSLKNSKVKEMVIAILKWALIMIGFGIVRAVSTSALYGISAQWLIIDIITYATLYISVTLGAWICIKAEDSFNN